MSTYWSSGLQKAQSFKSKLAGQTKQCLFLCFLKQRLPQWVVSIFLLPLCPFKPSSSIWFLCVPLPFIKCAFISWFLVWSYSGFGSFTETFWRALHFAPFGATVRPATARKVWKIVPCCWTKRCCLLQGCCSSVAWHWAFPHPLHLQTTATNLSLEMDLNSQKTDCLGPFHLPPSLWGYGR